MINRRMRANGRDITLVTTWLCPDNKPYIPAVTLHLDHPLRGRTNMTANEAKEIGVALIQMAYVAEQQPKPGIKPPLRSAS